jgi:hypothetical protein
MVRIPEKIGRSGKTFSESAIFSAVRWLFFLPIALIAAVVFIAIDILIIYGLVANEEYFRATSGTIANL